MNPLESLRLSWRSITGNPLRSSLTALGIVIGIAAVIAFVSLGASLQAGVIGEISPDDQRNIYGWAADPDAQAGPGVGAQPVFSQEDLDTVADLGAVEAAYGYAPVQTQSVSHSDDSVALGEGVIATGQSYVRSGTLAEGRQFEPGEREAVLNPASAEQFDEPVTVGDTLTITFLAGDELTVEVVGITETSAGLSPFEGFEESPRLYVPTDPFYAAQFGEGAASAAIMDQAGGETDADSATQNTADTGELRYAAIVVEAPSSDEAAISDAREQTTTYLESDAADASDFLDEDLELSLETSTELLQQLQDIFDLIQDFIVGIAAISLLVASIGIANIMLVSVTERTREIGIMKAVGAQNREVLGLFLTESIVLGVSGAIVGTMLGLVAGYLGAWYIDLPLVYPVEYVVLAIVVGIVVGIVSGLYPAWRAARIDPIDALRYE